MWEYILKSGLCLFFLYGFYRIFLENEQFNKFNRFYLITILVFSFILPLLSFSYSVKTYEMVEPGLETILVAPSGSSVYSESLSHYLPVVLLSIYLIGVLVFGIRLTRNLKAMFSEIRSNEKIEQYRYIMVLIKKRLSPYSFLSYIFLNKEEYENGQISPAIIRHEKVHVDEKHSLDLLLIELLQVIFWFNPLFYWIKRSMKLNHEYLADKAVVKNDLTPFQYSKLLFSYSSGHYHNSLSSPMSQSLIKKRILMITKTFSLKKLLLRLGLLVPVIAMCIYFFSNEIKANTVLITSESQMHMNAKFDQDPDVVSIKIEDQKLYVDGSEIAVNKFQSYLDSKLADLSDKEISDVGLKMKMINPDKAFLKEVNKVFSKTRMAKVTGMQMLPPPPPAPPVAKGAPEAPQPPNAPGSMDEEEIEMEIFEKNGKKKIIKKEIISSSEDVQAPPPPPNPIEEIDKIKEAGGSFFYNDKEITAEKAKELVTSLKELNIDIKKIKGGTQKVSITDN